MYPIMSPDLSPRTILEASLANATTLARFGTEEELTRFPESMFHNWIVLSSRMQTMC